MSRVLKKQIVEDENVYDAALRRMRKVYERFDTVVVSFSGGKDSTACLNVTLEVAREFKRLPLEICFWDEEIIQPETIEYMERVRLSPEINLKWVCLPIKHRNACSRQEPYWYPWDDTKKELWVRDMPDNPQVISQLEGYTRGDQIVESFPLLYPYEKYGTIAMVRGIRTHESMRRYGAVASRVEDNFLTRMQDGGITAVSPIYDWTAEDVWLAPALKGWDYNHAYDRMQAVGLTINQQRVAPPLGEEPLRILHMFQECFPEMWHKMTKRVHGVATAARYNNDELYTSNGLELPKRFKTYRDYFDYLIELNKPSERAQIINSVNQGIKQHNNKSRRPIPDEIPDGISGASWKLFCFIAIRGDFKGRKMQNMTIFGSAQLHKQGITLNEAKEKWGNNGRQSGHKRPPNQSRAMDSSKRVESKLVQPKQDGSA